MPLVAGVVDQPVGRPAPLLAVPLGEQAGAGRLGVHAARDRALQAQLAGASTVTIRSKPGP